MITRTATLESTVAKQSEKLVEQTEKMDKNRADMFNAIKMMNHRFDQSFPVSRPHSDTSNWSRHNTSGTTSTYSGVTRLAKLDFPRFRGDKIKEWLFKIEQFFEIDKTPEDYKVSLVSLHLDGLASIWHQSIVNSEVVVAEFKDWEVYKNLLQEQFVGVFVDPLDEIKKLRETDGIEDYHEQFELLRARVNLTETELVRAFLDGLRTDTQLNILMFKPQTINQCLSIGRMYELAHPPKNTTKDCSRSQINSENNIQPRNILLTEEMSEREEDEDAFIQSAAADLLHVKEESVNSLAAGEVNQIQGNEKENEFIQLAEIMDAEQADCNIEHMKISAENTKFARFHPLDRERLTKEESIVQVRLPQVLDDVHLQQKSFNATMGHAQAALTNHSTVAAAQFQFFSSSLLNESTAFESVTLGANSPLSAHGQVDFFRHDFPFSHQNKPLEYIFFSETQRDKVHTFSGSIQSSAKSTRLKRFRSGQVTGAYESDTTRLVIHNNVWDPSGLFTSTLRSRLFKQGGFDIVIYVNKVIDTCRAVFASRSGRWRSNAAGKQRLRGREKQMEDHS